MTVDIPFAFFAAGQSFDAGHYILRPVSNGLIRIVSTKTNGLYVPTHSAQRSLSDKGGTTVVFHCYGDTRFLAAIWINGNLLGRELFVSRAEIEAAQHTAEMKLASLRAAQ